MMRIMGILLPVGRARAAGPASGARRVPGAYPRLLAQVLAWAALLPALVVAMWPYLWAAPWTNFTQAFTSICPASAGMAVVALPRRADLGPAPALALRAHLVITTPPLYLAAFGLGAGADSLAVAAPGLAALRHGRGVAGPAVSGPGGGPGGGRHLSALGAVRWLAAALFSVSGATAGGAAGAALAVGRWWPTTGARAAAGPASAAGCWD
ncbi:MAG: hypothetical protein WKG07_21555 [Hymenobacter sp.]